MQIFEEALRLKRLSRASAIATIVECRGSSPQKQGAKMLVRDDGSLLGTLGGGCLEADVVQAALMTMKDGNPLTLPFELTERGHGPCLYRACSAGTTPGYPRRGPRREDADQAGAVHRVSRDRDR